MNSTATTNLIVSNLGQFGIALLAILAVVIVIGIGVLIFNTGYSAIKQSGGVSFDFNKANETRNWFRRANSKLRKNMWRRSTGN